MSFRASLKAVRAKTLPEEPLDGAKACQARIASTKKTLCSILPSVVELPEKLSIWEKEFWEISMWFNNITMNSITEWIKK